MTKHPPWPGLCREPVAVAGSGKKKTETRKCVNEELMVAMPADLVVPKVKVWANLARGKDTM